MVLPLTVFMASMPLVLFGGATPPYEFTLEPLVSYISITFPLVMREVRWDTSVRCLLKLWNSQLPDPLLKAQHFNEAPSILIFISLVNLIVVD